MVVCLPGWAKWATTVCGEQLGLAVQRYNKPEKAGHNIHASVKY